MTESDDPFADWPKPQPPRPPRPAPAGAGPDWRKVAKLLIGRRPNDRITAWPGVASWVWLGAALLTGLFSSHPPAPRADPAVTAVGSVVWIALVASAVIVLATIVAFPLHQQRCFYLAGCERAATATRVASTVAMTLSLGAVALWAGYPALVALAAAQGPR